MALLLTIVAPRENSLGDQSSVVFGVGGGRIGRALDNDWVLPDPLRYLSSHHARVKFRHGTYFIEDTSTNGVYLNDANEPLGHAGPQPLHSGDVLRLGTYQINVSVEEDGAYDSSVIVPVAPAAGARGPAERDMGVDLPIDELLIDHSGQRERATGPVDAYGQPAFLPAGRDTHREVPRDPPRAEEPVRRPARSAGAAESGIEAFCRGAGLDPSRLPADSQTRALHVAGLLLREALVGVKELAGTHRELRPGGTVPPQDAERESLNRLPVEDLLVKLLDNQPGGSLDAVQWLRELFSNARAHDSALMRALRAALADFIPRLDPVTLGQGRAPEQRFRSLTEMPGGQLPHLFAEALTRSYEEELHRRG